MSTTRLSPSFYTRDTLQVARDLLGRTLCRRLADGRVLRGRLVEVEAYDGPRDRASHAFRGRTPRNAPMFEAGGIAYVYLVYGMHHCLNVVCGARGYPAAILLRGAEAPEGTETASGPGRLTRAFQVDRALDRVSFLGDEMWLEEGAPVLDAAVRRTARIGVDYAGSWARRRLRFVMKERRSLTSARSVPAAATTAHTLGPVAAGAPDAPLRDRREAARDTLRPRRRAARDRS